MASKSLIFGAVIKYSSNEKVRILSIDGGGIRGILPGVILSRLEAKLQEKVGPKTRLSDFFDFMAGTSTGGILALAYLMPDRNKRPKLTAEEVVNIYLERGDEIFDTSLWQKIKSVRGIVDEKYDAKELEETLEETFEDIWLTDLLKPCIISSYDIRNGKPHFFKQHKAKNSIFNFKVKEVARATSAAPTYFETARVKNSIGTPFPLIDGGVFVNNPSLVAYSEVRTMTFDSLKLPTAKDMMIVSVGTGASSKKYEYKNAKDWGAVGWIRPIIEIMMSGNAQAVHYHLTQIYDTLSPKDKKDYHRLDPELLRSDPEMDNASIDNMRKLNEDALSYLAKPEKDKELNDIRDKLLKYA